jgi:hypothetical protein
MISRDMVIKLADALGYDDIDPERAKEEWCTIHPTLI